MITITITETKFEKRTQADVFRAISNSFAARNKCAAAQKAGDKPRQAELYVNKTHVANIAVWGGSDIDNFETYEDFFNNASEEEIFGVPTDAWWTIWKEHKAELKSRGVFTDKDGDGWVIGRFAVNNPIPIGDFHPDTDTGTIADALAVDEDEVIAAIHNTPKLISPHDTIDAWLNATESVHAGQAATGRWADQFADKLSPHPKDIFFEIRNRDPERRKYAITETAIIVRECIDGDFYDNEYPIDAEIADLIQSLRK